MLVRVVRWLTRHHDAAVADGLAQECPALLAGDGRVVRLAFAFEPDAELLLACLSQFDLDLIFGVRGQLVRLHSHSGLATAPGSEIERTIGRGT